MILCLSSSGREAIAALVSSKGELVCETRESSWPRQTGDLDAAIESLLKEAGVRIDDVSRIVSDVGPGSFTGVKVCVTMAKVLAYARQIPVAGLISNRLMPPAPRRAVAIKRGEWVLFTESEIEVVASQEPPAEVWHAAYDEQSHPFSFAHVASALDSLESVAAEELLPFYATEPSISTPKPRGLSAASGGAE